MPIDTKTLIQRLNRTSIKALELGVQDAVERRNGVVSPAHFLLGCLRSGPTDVRSLVSAQRVGTAEDGIVGELSRLPGNVASRPTFMQTLLDAFQASDERLAASSKDIQSRPRLRTGHILFTFAQDPEKYGVKPILEALFGGALPHTVEEYLIGQELPDSGSPAKAQPTRELPRRLLVHTVSVGERLIDIARTYACDPEDIATDNHISIDFAVSPGQRLEVRPLLEYWPEVTGATTH